MEINVTDTKEQIIDYITDLDLDEIYSIIRDIDEAIEDWDFTILLWLYFNSVIQKGKKYFSDFESEIENVKKQFENLSAVDTKQRKG